MADHPSAQKRARQNIKRAARNLPILSHVKSAMRTFRTAATSGDKAKAKTALTDAVRVLYKAASKGALHKRNASRRVSRLSATFNALG